MSDQLLMKNKKLFFGVFAVLAATALAHLGYVILAMRNTGDRWLLQDYGMLALGLVMLSLLAGICLLCSTYRKEWIWLIVFFLLGVVSMRVLPGLSAPDEPDHYISAYRLSNQLMFQEAADEQGQVYIREQDKYIEAAYAGPDAEQMAEENLLCVFGQEMREETYEQAKNWKQLFPAEQGVTVSRLRPVQTTPLVYVPQAVGITLARLFHVSSPTLINFGRTANLLAFCALVFTAICLMPFGKELMMASTLLPATLQLTSSMSYDALLIGGAYLFLAVVLRLAYGPDRVTGKWIAVLAVILAVIAPCKLVYSVLIFFLLLIPKEKYSTGTQRILIWVICALAVILPMILVNGTLIRHFATDPGQELDWAGEPSFTIAYALRHPFQTARIVYDTVLWQGEYYMSSLFGAHPVYGDNSLNVPFVVELFLGVGLILLSMKQPSAGLQGTLGENGQLQTSTGFGPDGELSCRDRWITAAVCVVLAGLLFGSMLIAWTPVSSATIIGVQGRYFLPVLPMLLLLLKNRLVVLTADSRNVVLFLMVACDAFSFFRLYSLISLHL